MIAQLSTLEIDGALDPSELAAAVLRTLSTPGVAEFRPHLVPELALYGASDSGVLMAGRADAIAFDNGQPVAVFDWKSDVSTSEATRQAYARQLRQYMEAVGAPRGAVVYLSLERLDWIELARADAALPRT